MEQNSVTIKISSNGSKKSGFIKERGATGILSSLGLKTPLNKIPLLGDILLQIY